MTKIQLQKERKMVVNETHKRSKLDERLKDERISRYSNLFLFAQVLLDKIGSGKNTVFSSTVYKKTINFYCKEMKRYA